MKYQSRLFFCIILGLSMTFYSCVKDSDMNQENSIQLSSVITSELFSSYFDTNSLLDLKESNRMFQTDTTFLELTSSNFLMDELSKTILNFKIKNSLEREFKVDILFLNDLDELKFSLQIPVSSGSKEKPITVETNVAIEIPEITTFKESTKMVFNISVLPSDKELSSDTPGRLELQSSATYFLDF